MKDNHTKRYGAFVLLVLLFALAALFQLQARIRLESRDKAVAVVMLQDDVIQLANADGEDPSRWYQTLSDAGLTAVIVPAEQMDNPDVITPIETAGLDIAQLGGAGSDGLYFAPVEYDIQLSKGKTVSTSVASADSGRIWTMVENNPQTGCVLPEAYLVNESDAPWAKGFYLRQNIRARAAATELNDVQEVGDMLFRAVIDRGVQVLWITPLGDEDGINSEFQTYESLLNHLQMRIERCGYHFGMPQGLEALGLPRPVLILCGMGIFAAAVLLLCLLFGLQMRLAWILYLICALESVVGGLLKPQLQAVLLSLGASAVFPALSVYYLGMHLAKAKDNQSVSLWDYLRTILIGALITVIGGAYIGAVLGSWKYILVLQVFRGVKLSQFTVYLLSIILTAVLLLELRSARDLKLLLPSVNRKLLVRVISALIILVGVGMIYLMRSGDGMLSVSSLEVRFRSVLENLILYRPRTKEFLIAWPAVSLAFCFAARGDRLFAWLFGAMGGIGFASIANTFCHIRAHYLVSIARTALGLVIGLALGTILFVLFRPAGSERKWKEK